MRSRSLLLALATALGLGLVTATPAAAEPDASGRIVWTQVLDEEFSTARIVSARPDGSGVRRLTRPGPGTFDLNAAISPDGRHVVFEGTLPDESIRLIIVGSDGRGEGVLNLGCLDTCYGDVDPTWTPSGGGIVFTRIIGPFDQVNESARSAVLYTVRIDGTGLRRLSEPGIDGVVERADRGSHRVRDIWDRRRGRADTRHRDRPSHLLVVGGLHQQDSLRDQQRYPPQSQLQSHLVA